MTEHSAPRGLAQRLAKAVEALGGTVPVDLERIADQLGVAEIRRVKMVEDGRTTWTNGRPRIELREDRPLDRSRFTLAHEIGHVLVAHDESVARRTQSLDNDDLEIVCDWIAASILMPRSWIARYAEREQFNLSFIRLIANRASVSMSAAAVRIAEVSGRTCVLLRWQRAPSRWLIVGQAAVPRRYVGVLEATPETTCLLDALASRRDTWCELGLVAGGTHLGATAHVDRSGLTCMTLITELREG